MDSPNLPAKRDAESLTFGQRHPILKQAADDARQLTWQQIGIPALGAMGNLIYILIGDYSAHRLDLLGSLGSLVFSLLIGVALYVLVAILRAPFIVIGRQHRDLIDLRARISEVEIRPTTTTLALPLPLADAAEPNIVLHLDGGSIEAHTGSIGIGEGHSVFDFRAVVIRCKNERQTQPSRRVGGIANVSGEISFTGYGPKPLHLPGERSVWLSDPSESVDLAAGATQRLVVATLKTHNDKNELCAVQRRSARSGPQVWNTELTDDLGDIFRVRLALYALSERKPLARGDYILERDGRLFGRDETFSGPQLIPTQIWRSSQALRFWRRLYEFWKLDSDGVSLEQFEADYKACEAEASKFIQQHYGEAERRQFLFEPEPESLTTVSPNPFRRPKRKSPANIRERLDSQQKQLDRLEKASAV